MIDNRPRWHRLWALERLAAFAAPLAHEHGVAVWRQARALLDAGGLPPFESPATGEAGDQRAELARVLRASLAAIGADDESVWAWLGIQVVVIAEDKLPRDEDHYATCRLRECPTCSAMWKRWQVPHIDELGEIILIMAMLAQRSTLLFPLAEHPEAMEGATIALARCLGNPVSLPRLDLVWCPGARRLYCGHGHVVLPETPGGAILERLLRVEPARVRRNALVTALESSARARPEALTRALREACGIVSPVGLTVKGTPAPTGDRLRLEHAGRA